MKYKYCPNGNLWEDVSGIFDTKTYMFCTCNKCNGKVYELRPIDVTKKISKRSIEGFNKSKRLRELRTEINFKNMEELAKLIKQL